MTVTFYGCPAGLGNRFEELALLSKFALQNEITIDYYWNNSFELKYKPIFKAKNINIKEVSNLKKWPTKEFESSRYWREYISKEDIEFNNNITIKNNYPTPQEKYISIHVRGTDRIKNKGTNFHPAFQTIEDVDYCLKEIHRELKKNSNNLKIAIFSEDTLMINKLKKELAEFDILSLPRIKNLEKIYEDFYYIANSEKLILCSKFSTFSLSAAMIKNIGVLKFFNYEDPSLKRWRNNYVTSKSLENLSTQNSQKSEFYKNKQMIKIGNNFINSFLIDLKIIQNISLLISLNNSSYYGVEEHIKLVNHKVEILMMNLSLFKNQLHTAWTIIKNEKNRKTKIFNLINETRKSIKIFGFKSFFTKSKKIKLNNKNFFIYGEAEKFIEEYTDLVKHDLFLGSVLVNINSNLCEDIINLLKKIDPLNKISFEIKENEVEKSNGYIYLYKN